METSNLIVSKDDRLLLTGGTGFIGARVLECLRRWGFRNIRCLVRHSSDLGRLEASLNDGSTDSKVEVVRGNLLSGEDCKAITRDVTVIYHLAAGTGTKSHADAFLNSVVTTRNLLEGVLTHGCLKRLVSVSSFAVYAGGGRPPGGILDETYPIEDRPDLRADAYSYAKVEQDRLIADYGRTHGIQYVLMRPGVVYGPGKSRIHGRVGLDTFGLFLHLGGSNPLPLTHVDNCAEAIALAGLRRGVDGEVFNVVDDDLPSCRRFLRLYKQDVRRFASVYVPHSVSYLLCSLWEKYSNWSQGQLPPVYSRRAWAAYWRPTRYSNRKLKQMLQWTPRVETAAGLKQFFASCREETLHA